MAKKIELWPLDRLRPYDRNPRKHSEQQIAQLVASIHEFGFNNPILVDGDKGIIAGHGRLVAARLAGLENVPVVVLDHLTDAQRRAYIIADNRLAEIATWDDGLLTSELEALRLDDFDLTVVGFTEHELAGLLDVETVEPAVPDPPRNPVAKAGELWLLGDNRLVCGDATADSAVGVALGGELADLVFTDPPYNVDYEGYTDEHMTIQGDAMGDAEYRVFLNGAFAELRAGCKGTAGFYICHASRYQAEVEQSLLGAGIAVRNQIIWAKSNFAWGRGRYKFQHEPIFYCHVLGISDPWYGDKRQTTLWVVDKPAANRLHPTMKPVELVQLALRNSSQLGDTVLDTFGGSGSTMIACSDSGRRCSMVELDPAYIDVIIQRWEDHTGGKAKRAAKKAAKKTSKKGRKKAGKKAAKKS